MGKRVKYFREKSEKNIFSVNFCALPPPRGRSRVLSPSSVGSPALPFISSNVSRLRRRRYDDADDPHVTTRQRDDVTHKHTSTHTNDDARTSWHTCTQVSVVSA